MPGPSIVSCPTCGRTRVDLMRVAAEVEEGLIRACARNPGLRVPKVAVMGCAVNGPGEAKGADVALCGGDGEFSLFVRGECVGKVSERDAVRKVLDHAIHL